METRTFKVQRTITTREIAEQCYEKVNQASDKAFAIDAIEASILTCLAAAEETRHLNQSEDRRHP